MLGNPLAYIDPLGLAPPQYMPSSVSISDNVRQAQNMSSLDFYQAVRNGGKWDYKQLGSQFQEFGNYNYGVTGRAAGFSENTLLRMAGWAQHSAGTSSPEWGHPLGKSPFGDDPNDQRWIKEGIKDFDEGWQWDDGNSCLIK